MYNASSAGPQPSKVGTDVDDLSQLPLMNKHLFLYHIKRRYQDSQKIYTFMGDSALVFINPRAHLGLQSSPEILWRIRDQCLTPGFSPEPHTYSLVAKMYNRMMSKGNTQYLMVSGATGSGKTECTDRAIEYLINASKSQEKLSHSSITRHGMLGDSLANACAILEPFIHAEHGARRTRACVIKAMAFDKRGELESWCMSVPFLDWDILTRGANEVRNFNIFYMLLAGATDEELNMLGIIHGRDPSYFPYTRRQEDESEAIPSSTSLDDAYAEDYRIFRNAVSASNVNGEVFEALKLVAAVLHLGKLEFQWDNSLRTVVVENSKPNIVNTIAKLLGVKSTTVYNLLCRSRNTMKFLFHEEESDIACAKAIRDTFVVEVYQRAIRIILKCLNQIGSAQKSTHSPGHEIAENWIVNGFPDRSIVVIDSPGQSKSVASSGFTANSLLERLHQGRFRRMRNLMHFQEEEGLKSNLSEIWAGDNKDTVEKLNCMRQILDETIEACVNNSTEKNSMVDTCSEKMRDWAQKTQTVKAGGQDMGCVAHFDRNVVYDWPKVITQNIMSALFQKVATKAFAESSHDSIRQVSTPVARPWIQGSRLTKLLFESMSTAEIICIRSNSQSVPIAFDTDHVAKELQLSGAFFLNSCSQLHFAHHYSCESFYRIFHQTVPTLPTLHELKNSENFGQARYMSHVLDGCKLIKARLLKIKHGEYKLDQEQIQVCMTQVFVRTDEAMKQLMTVAEELSIIAATKIQSISRMYLVRSRLLRHVYVHCHFARFDWKRESVLMGYEDDLAANLRKIELEHFLKSEEEVQRRRLAEAKMRNIEREVAFLENRRKKHEKRKNAQLLKNLRTRAHRRIMAIKLQSCARGMLSRRGVQCWIQCNRLARARGKGAAYLESALLPAREVLLKWRGGTETLERHILMANKRIKASRRIMQRRADEATRAPRAPSFSSGVINEGILWM